MTGIVVLRGFWSGEKKVRNQQRRSFWSPTEGSENKVGEESRMCSSGLSIKGMTEGSGEGNDRVDSKVDGGSESR